MYDYTTPQGYGDSFFVYAFQGEDANLVNGDSYSLQQIPILDAAFVCRLWSGAHLVVLTGMSNPGPTDGTVQVYDTVKNSWFWLPILSAGLFPPAFAVIPEKRYIVTTAIAFDLNNVQLAVNNNGTNQVYADQMAFYGVRRQLGGKADPSPSLYEYTEEEYSYESAFQIDNYGPTVPLTGLATGTTYTIPITDCDFELRRIIYSVGGAGVKATLAIAFGDIFYWTLQAVSAGAGGNAITFALTGIGTPGLPLTISVIADAISVQLATDGAGNGISTVQDVVNLIASTPAAAALVTSINVFNPSFNIVFNFGPSHLAGGSGSGGGSSPYRSPFKITLYDSDKYQRSNIPLLAEFLCQSYQASPSSNAAYNFFPAPPILYKNDSVIQFDIYSLIPTPDGLPVTVTLTFKGVRRIPCH